MPGARFLRAELDYGCHVEGTIEIPNGAAPVVVFGPNGSGKTTFLEALVRTLFGFNRMQEEERRRMESRSPWTGGTCTAEVEIEKDGGERFRIRREFDGSEVRIEPLDGGPAWTGDGNPASRNQEANEYRRRLAEIFGFSEIEPYLRTACVTQGGLVGTRLGEDLLQIAGGGYGGVDEALETLQKAHREITTRPIATGSHPGRTPKKIEELGGRIDELRERLARAESAFRRREPILAELDAAEEEIGSLAETITRLETALGPLNERRTIRERKERLEERLRTLGRVAERVREAAADVEDADRVVEEAGETYPADFLERTGRLEGLWSDRDELRAERNEHEAELRDFAIPSPWTAVLIGLVAALVGAVLVLAGAPVWAGLALAGAGVGLAAALLVRRSRRSRHRHRIRDRMREIDGRLEAIGRRVADELEGVPRAASLAPESLPERKREFQARRGARQHLDAARAELARTIEDAREALGEAAPERPTEPPLEAAAAVGEACEEARESARTSVARAAIELDEVEAVELPEGVEATPDAVGAALASRRERREELQREILRLRERLLHEGSGEESPVALRDRIAALEEARAELEREADAHRAAYALVEDSYKRFRERDQQRFVESISEALEGFGENALGPLEVAGGLADARIRLHGRAVPLESPPLSYGEYHAALFSIRLGASDFLARAGVRPPLIVDEPFAYLDLDRAREMWTLLRRIARDRQVFVATQERLTLEALGIEPDLEFERPGTVAPRGQPPSPGAA